MHITLQHSGSSTSMNPDPPPKCTSIVEVLVLCLVFDGSQVYWCIGYYTEKHRYTSKAPKYCCGCLRVSCVGTTYLSVRRQAVYSRLLCVQQKPRLRYVIVGMLVCVELVMLDASPRALFARHHQPCAFRPLPTRRTQLLQRSRKRETYLEVNLGHVNEFRPQLLDVLTLRPVEYLPLFEQVRVYGCSYFTFSPSLAC